MKHFYSLLAATMASLTLQAQNPTYGNVQTTPDMTPEKLMVSRMKPGVLPQESFARQQAQTAKKQTQDPKWLTNLPVDSAIFRQEFIPYEEGSVAWFSTVYYDNLTKYFVGNRIKTIRTLIPEFAKDITVWIKDVSGATEVLLWESTLPEDVKTNEIIDVPCDLLIDKAYKMQVGFNFTVTKTNPVYPAIVPCNRTESWIQGHSDTNDGRPLDYTSMRNFIYGDPHPYYGYYFHCITEGEAGLPDYELQLHGASHTRVLPGTNTECNIFFESYGAKPIENLTFESRTAVENHAIEINYPVSYLGYGSFTATAKASPKPERLPINIKISKINGEPAPKELGAEGSLTSINKDESYPRNVVMEEFTGTWCGWCPRGMRSIELLNEQYGEKFIPIAVHFNDKLQNDYFSEIVQYSNGNFPGCTLNRKVQCEPYYGTSVDNSPFYITNDVEDMMGCLTEAQINIDHLSFNKDSRSVNITTSTRFNIDCHTEAYAMSYVITEDSIQDIQTNYYFVNRDNPEAVEEDFRDLTQKPEHWLTQLNHVGRCTYETFGLAGSIAKDIKRYEQQHFTYEFKLPENIKNANNLHVVALLLDTKSGEIVNACQQHIRKAETTGISTTTSQPFAEISANHGTLTIKASKALMKIYSINGKLVSSQPVNGTLQLQPGKGPYLVRLEQDNQVLVKKIAL